MRIIKRSGELEVFDPNKVRRCMLMAISAGDEEIPDTSVLIGRVVDDLDHFGETVGIDEIQDAIERCLLESGFVKSAKAYINYRLKRDYDRGLREKPHNRALADYIHASKYARYQPDLGRREVFSETIDRVLAMHINKFASGDIVLGDKIEEMFSSVYSYRVLPSMRSMQFAGAAIEKDNARIYNCCFTLADRDRVFQEAFYLLLCGCGVGYSVQWLHIRQLSKLSRVNKRRVYHHTIEDTIIGWADALGALIKSVINGYWIEFDYSKIRDAGEILRTSGGRAPGHLPLRDCLEKIREHLLMIGSRKMRPIEVHDIFCYVAEAVLAGGIRRSSLISLFSADDTEMMYAKSSGVFDYSGKNSQRAMANNSAVLLPGYNRDIFNRIIDLSVDGYGEPGFYFSKSIDYGTNPCGEIGLYPRIKAGISLKTGFAFCNLCEINGSLVQNKYDFFKSCLVASAIGTMQAGYVKFDYLGTVSELIARRDSLLGVGIMGVANNPSVLLDAKVLREGVEIVNETNKNWASMLGVGVAARTTTIKPGGTAPKEASVTEIVGSGIHPHHARRTFMGITANPLEPVGRHFRSVNPHMVSEKPNGDLFIVFPVEVSEGAKTTKNSGACELLSNVITVYENWILPGNVSEGGLSHNVSCTLTIKPEEVDRVKEMIWQNRDKIGSLSFAPYLLDKNVPWIPREECTDLDEDRWNMLIRGYRAVDWSEFKESEDQTNPLGEAACSGGSCEL